MFSNLDFDLGRTCIVCNSPITNTNPDGIGCQCREIYTDAKFTVFFENHERANKFYAITNMLTFKWFMYLHRNTKFRSSWKKSFHESVETQYLDKHFLSKKQSEIMLDWCFYNEYPKCTCEQYQQFTIEEKQAKHKQFMLVWDWNYSESEHDRIIALAESARREQKRSA